MNIGDMAKAVYRRMGDLSLGENPDMSSADEVVRELSMAAQNVVLGLSVCAERHAVAAAVAAGKRRFRRLAIVSDGESSVPPCGACRQVLREFEEDLEILLGDDEGGWRVLRLSDLLPEAFVCYPRKTDA